MAKLTALRGDVGIEDIYPKSTAIRVHQYAACAANKGE